MSRRAPGCAAERAIESIQEAIGILAPAAPSQPASKAAES
jgi:hypothetical protein